MSQKIPPPATGITRVIKAAGYSWHGIIYAWKNEAAFRQETVLFVIATIIALMSDVSNLEKAVLIFSVGLVIIIEILNSAVEAVVDRFGKEFHILSKAAKDMGSAAVFISLFLAAITWFLIYFPLIESYLA
ncbi:MAG: diacylglycerol kinase (ATP) [Oceanospirillaceae bacterium]|jgi:diacylglycerol kinase (ATP)